MRQGRNCCLLPLKVAEILEEEIQEATSGLAAAKESHLFCSSGYFVQISGIFLVRKKQKAICFSPDQLWQEFS